MIKSESMANRIRCDAFGLLALAGAAAVAPASADQLYQADRANCMRGEATEAQLLCLIEAAAAMADRERGAQGGSARRHMSRRTAMPSNAAPAEKVSSAP